MKMAQKEFGLLSDIIDKVLSAHSLKIIKEHRQNISFVNSQFVSFCWSIFHAGDPDYMMFYKVGLNDRHIETALKRILSDFK
jgi:hypothetical protein